MSEQTIVFIISDSIGETAERVARAAASQFSGHLFEFRRIPYLDSEEDLKKIVEEARAANSLIIHTLVCPDLRLRLSNLARQALIPCVDIMGPSLAAMGDASKALPKLKAGLVYQLDEAYFREVEAVEFAVKYDDGKDPRGLLKADVVLIGVSRTSKTPVSMYLAHRGYRVANVPLVPEVRLPEEIFILPSRRLIGLSINAERLLQIRQERLQLLGLGTQASYASEGRVYEELEYAAATMARLGCAVIDVSQRAVEETASQIMRILADWKNL